MTEPRRLGRQSRGHRSRSRTIPIPGDETGEGEGNWYKCWSCGMHVNDVTDELDDGASKVHTTLREMKTLSLGGYNFTMQLRTRFHTFNEPLQHMQVRLANADGSAREVVHEYFIVDTKGCPNDGNLNWRGDH